ncbi:transposable element Tc1 transposase [Trichonephila clavipes]|nr:transposable element Tc1 transposase [Trichonephila clavipes]
MPRRRIRAHYEQLSEFETERIIVLKEGVFDDEFLFHLSPVDLRRRVCSRPRQRADPAVTTACSTRPQQGVVQVNVKPHTTRVAMNCLTAYQTLPCPARLTDSSPIEHVWSMMGRRLNVDDLDPQFQKIWQEMPQEMTRVLYHSMSRRGAVCI